MDGYAKHSEQGSQPSPSWLSSFFTAGKPVSSASAPATPSIDNSNSFASQRPFPQQPLTPPPPTQSSTVNPDPPVTAFTLDPAQYTTGVTNLSNSLLDEAEPMSRRKFSRIQKYDSASVAADKGTRTVSEVRGAAAGDDADDVLEGYTSLPDIDHTIPDDGTLKSSDDLKKSAFSFIDISSSSLSKVSLPSLVDIRKSLFAPGQKSVEKVGALELGKHSFSEPLNPDTEEKEETTNSSTDLAVPANNSSSQRPSATPPEPRPTVTLRSAGMTCNLAGCFNPAGRYRCPVCYSKKFPKETSVFCCQEHFEKSWPEHKKIHASQAAAAKNNSSAEPKANDGYQLSD
eukprot:TRINITY_DN35_c0_g1_i1.p1 TRINITY_DN35_c0_g1~~TRINITY_DN35_c0_g1_i1.p1  ORF type:complete len:344 (+),score=76.89 TRINITY_DN35_c0_g1_i1:949-1980(+)